MSDCFKGPIGTHDNVKSACFHPLRENSRTIDDKANSVSQDELGSEKRHLRPIRRLPAYPMQVSESFSRLRDVRGNNTQTLHNTDTVHPMKNG